MGDRDGTMTFSRPVQVSSSIQVNLNDCNVGWRYIVFAASNTDLPVPYAIRNDLVDGEFGGWLSATLKLQCVYSLEHFIGVSIRLDLGPDLTHDAVFIDQEK